MKKHHIPFQKIEWEVPSEFVKQKIVERNKLRLRLLRFEDGFEEKDWCTKGHTGYVVDGEIKIDFNGTITTYKKGDGLWIEKGEEHKHKAIIEKGKFVELFLVES